MVTRWPGDLDEIDLSDLEFWALPWEQRESAFAALRRERPIAHFEDPLLETSLDLPRGDGYYALMRHADVSEASRHPEIYRSGQGAVSMVDMPPEMLEFFGGMINTDNPRHTRLRRIVSQAFNPRMIRSIEATIQSVAVETIDRASALGGCDFVVDIAARLPLKVICDMMGVPESEYATVFRCSNVILSMGDPEYVPEGDDPLVAFINAGVELREMMEELGRFRLESPTDDLTSALVNANVDGEALSRAELASFFILLVVAGNETTRNAISHGLLALTEHPDQRARWVSDFEGLASTAAEEIVRWASPVIWMRRTLAEDTELSGTSLRAGDKVILVYASANRDEDVFTDPFRFDVGRSPNPHAGFGAPGPHFCLGAHLAREEIVVMFRELLRRLPDIEATGEPDRLRSAFINGIKHLNCTYTPSGG